MREFHNLLRVFLYNRSHILSFLRMITCVDEIVQHRKELMRTRLENIGCKQEKIIFSNGYQGTVFSGIQLKFFVSRYGQLQAMDSFRKV